MRLALATALAVLFAWPAVAERYSADQFVTSEPMPTKDGKRHAHLVQNGPCHDKPEGLLAHWGEAEIELRSSAMTPRGLVLYAVADDGSYGEIWLIQSPDAPACLAILMTPRGEDA